MAQHVRQPAEQAVGAAVRGTDRDGLRDVAPDPELSRVERRTVTDSIIEQVADRVRNGGLAPGDAVPNELRLAEQLGVGRSSVREALKALQAVGILERRHDGTVVGANARVAALRLALHAGWRGRDVELAHLFEARRMLEGAITALAAERLDDEVLAELERLARDMRSVPRDDFDGYFVLDMRFHSLICDAAGNPVFAQLWSVIHEMLLDSRPVLLAAPELLSLSDDNHVAVLAALQGRDPGRARDAVHAALHAVEALVLDTLARLPQEKE